MVTWCTPYVNEVAAHEQFDWLWEGTNQNQKYFQFFICQTENGGGGRGGRRGGVSGVAEGGRGMGEGKGDRGGEGRSGEGWWGRDGVVKGVDSGTFGTFVTWIWKVAAFLLISF